MACRAGAAFLGGVGQQVDFCACGRLGAGQGQGIDFFGDIYLEFHHVIHIVGSHDVEHGHLFALTVDDDGTLGSLEERIVGEGNAVFGDEESIACLQQLVVLVIRGYREDGLLGFFHPFGGLRHAPLRQQAEGQS